MSKTCPIVVVSCLRDIKLLELQAQSISKCLTEKHDIYIIVNETVLANEWTNQFNLRCRNWYQNHNLTILYKQEFNCFWSKNPSARWAGWDNQQLLKLAISSKLNSSCYFVLDSQNFLIKPWSTSNYSFDNKIPGRKNLYSMNQDTWIEYSTALGLPTSIPKYPVMTISTPIYLRNDLVDGLIDHFNGLKEFSSWFFERDCSLSEFVLYFLWSEKRGGYDSFHYDIGFDNTWNGPMMRLKEETNTVKERSFSFFIENLGKKKNEAWVSITHNSWSLLNDDEYQTLLKSLKNHSIDINLLKN